LYGEVGFIEGIAMVILMYAFLFIVVYLYEHSGLAKKVENAIPILSKVPRFIRAALHALWIVGIYVFLLYFGT
jgi:Ca2+/Na+ antiporter